MKKTKSLFLILMLICVISILFLTNFNTQISADAVNIAGEPTLEIVGKSTQKIEADSAEIFVRIENVDMSLDVSKDKTMSQFDSAKNSLIANGISSEQIKITSFNTNPSYDYSSGKTLVGYYAILTFSYELDNLSTFTNNIDSLISSGITEINYVNFKLSNAEEVYQQNLNLAVENAIQNAKKLLEKDEITVLEIEEESSYYSPILYRNFSIEENMDNTIEIYASVKIKCK